MRISTEAKFVFDWFLKFFFQVAFESKNLNLLKTDCCQLFLKRIV